MRRLKSVDFPTLGRPTNATSALIEAAPGLVLMLVLVLLEALVLVLVLVLVFVLVFVLVLLWQRRRALRRLESQCLLIGPGSALG